jgi:hypothetical protein
MSCKLRSGPRGLQHLVSTQIRWAFTASFLREGGICIMAIGNIVEHATVRAMATFQGLSSSKTTTEPVRNTGKAISGSHRGISIRSIAIICSRIQFVCTVWFSSRYIPDVFRVQHRRPVSSGPTFRSIRFALSNRLSSYQSGRHQTRSSVYFRTFNHRNEVNLRSILRFDLFANRFGVLGGSAWIGGLSILI